MQRFASKMHITSIRSAKNKMHTKNEHIIFDDIKIPKGFHSAKVSTVNFKTLYNKLYLSLLLPLSAFSVSWFIIDDFGNMQKNGVAQIENFEIDLSTLPKGNYSIRLMGEVHNFELS